MRLFPDRRALLVAAVNVAVLATGGIAIATGVGSSADYTTKTVRIDSADGVSIDATLYVPTAATAKHPAPAVVVGHGFGGSKQDVRGEAENLANHGYVVLAPTARGFGNSSGQVGLALPEYDGKDVTAEIDYLASRPEVTQDGPNDPRVAFTGASYGGGLALLAASTDHRVDAVAAVITWNSLTQSLLPNAGDVGGAANAPGVFKEQYAAGLFGAAVGPALPGVLPDAQPQPGDVCGRFAPAVCAAYAEVAAGKQSATTRALLDRASVASRIDKVTAPTLLVQGEDDSLFPLSEAVRTYTALRERSVPAAMVWSRGGHDLPFTKQDTESIRKRVLRWLDHYLRHDKTDPGPGFTWFEPTTGRTGTAESYPPGRSLPTSFVLGPGTQLTSGGEPVLRPQQVVNPPGGQPAAISSVPGLGGFSRFGNLLSGVIKDPPDQTAAWTSDALPVDVNLVGTPHVSVHVTSSTGEAVLFARLYDVSADGTARLPNGQVAPLRVEGAAGSGRDVRVELPTLAHTFARGHRIRLAFVATDRAYAGDRKANQIQVSGIAAASGLFIPSAPKPPAGGHGLRNALVLGALLALILLVVGRLLTRRNAARAAVRLGEADAAPVVAQGLTKVYADGNKAVDNVSFTVEPGQIVGLLGPNGSGKTTTLRMVLGLIQPTAGRALLFNEPTRPGAAVLSRFGVFVEGPGLLPHLSGRDNLILWWQATGARLEDAHLEEALEVAGLGKAIDKPVRSYSHGMKQRVALAQALLGQPDCLILDEPTNGLDPPQIREMRELIRRYAAQGKTVLVSSHLLSEVEMTCTHAVVMQNGRVIHSGPVDELLALGAQVHIAVDGDADAARRLLLEIHGVRGVSRGAADELIVDAAPELRPVLVRALVAAGFDVIEVSLRSRLEDVFLDLVGASESGHAVGSGGRV